MRVLVTGGGGFIGSHAVERLCRLGHEVRILDNFSTGSRANLVSFLDDVELIEGDIQSYERANATVRGCEVVFHQAALPSVARSVQDPLTSNAANVVGTLHILLAARGTTFRASCSRPRSRRKIREGMPCVAWPSGFVTHFNLAAGQRSELIHECIQSDPITCRDVEGLPLDALRFARQQVGVDDVAHVGEVARSLGVAEDNERLAA